MVDAGAVSPDKRLNISNHWYNIHVLFWMNIKLLQTDQAFQCLQYSSIVYIIRACLSAKSRFVFIPFAELCTNSKFPNAIFRIIRIINIDLIETVKII